MFVPSSAPDGWKVKSEEEEDSPLNERRRLPQLTSEVGGTHRGSGGWFVLRWWPAERPTPAPAPQPRRVTDDAIEDEVGDEEMYDDEFDDE